MRRWLQGLGPLVLVGIVAVMAFALVRDVRASGEEGPNRATVLDFYLAVIVALASVVAWAWRQWLSARAVPAVSSTAEQVEAAADLLAERTHTTWSEQAARYGITTPAPARVHWRWASPDLGVPRQDLNRSPNLPVDPPALSGDAEILGSGTVARLHDEVYMQLKHGRLALVGGPGAGKTGAMLLLLLAALRHRTHVGHADRASIPVPVWLHLGTWKAAAQPLREWVIESLRRDHPYLGAADFGADAASRLFDSGRIALFLDGLDEMSDGLREHAIRRMREESAGLRIVLTSRPQEYRATLAAGEQLPNTAVVDLRPVTPRGAVNYLLADRTPEDLWRWKPVTDEILSHPDGVLAQALNTPLTLSLTRSAGQESSPAKLIAMDLGSVELVRRYLLDQVLVSAYPVSEDREYVRYWLGRLAYQLNTTDPAGPERNLAWWRIPNYLGRGPGLWLALAGGLAFGIGGGLSIGLMFGLMFGVLFGVLISSSLSGDVPLPKQLVTRWPSSGELRLVLMAGLVLGTVVALVVGRIVGLVFGATSGLVVGVAIVLTMLVEVWGRPTSQLPDISPIATYILDRRYNSVWGLAMGLVFGVMIGTAVWVSEGLTAALTAGTVSGLAGLCLVWWGGAWGGLSLTELGLMFTARPHGRRVRFVPLLEEALERQVLRQAGKLYQFRHAELQDRLAAWYAAEHFPQAGS